MAIACEVTSIPFGKASRTSKSTRVRIGTNACRPIPGVRTLRMSHVLVPSLLPFPLCASVSAIRPASSARRSAVPLVEAVARVHICECSVNGGVVARVLIRHDSRARLVGELDDVPLSLVLLCTCRGRTTHNERALVGVAGLLWSHLPKCWCPHCCIPSLFPLTGESSHACTWSQ